MSAPEPARSARSAHADASGAPPSSANGHVEPPASGNDAVSGRRGPAVAREMLAAICATPIVISPAERFSLRALPGLPPGRFAPAGDLPPATAQRAERRPRAAPLGHDLPRVRHADRGGDRSCARRLLDMPRSPGLAEPDRRHEVPCRPGHGWQTPAVSRGPQAAQGQERLPRAKRCSTPTACSIPASCRGLWTTWR